MSNTALYQCDKCGFSTNNPVAFDLHPCRQSNGVNWNSRLIAIIAAIIFTASLFLSPAAKALNLVYLPLISFPAEVHGCDDCQAVNWNSVKVS